jgi:hypothetical protein
MYKVAVTIDKADTYQEVLDLAQEYSEEFKDTHLCLAWLVGAFNNQDINSVVHWVYILDIDNGIIII